jgi:hypothetical protein
VKEHIPQVIPMDHVGKVLPWVHIAISNAKHTCLISFTMSNHNIFKTTLASSATSSTEDIWAMLCLTGWQSRLPHIKTALGITFSNHYH